MNLLQHPTWAIDPTHFQLQAQNWLQPRAEQLAKFQQTLAPILQARSQTLMEYCQEKADEKFDLEYDPASGIGIMHISGIMAGQCDPIDEYCYECYNTTRIFENLKEAQEYVNLSAGLRLLLLHFDTPGGSVLAIPEAAQAILDFRRNNPQVLVLSWMNFCASAGIYLAMAAEYTAAPPYAILGSIGTMFASPDLSEAWKMSGISWTILTDGIYKAMGAKGLPLTEAQMDLIKQKLNEIGPAFKNFIKAQRPKITDAEMQGQTFSATQIPALCDHTTHQDPAEYLNWILQGLATTPAAAA